MKKVKIKDNHFPKDDIAVSVEFFDGDEPGNVIEIRCTEAGVQSHVLLNPDQIPRLCEVLLKAARKVLDE